MDKEIFEKELAMCRDLNRKNGGHCSWGKCADCGVIPLLRKICKGEILETKEAVDAARHEVFKKVN